MGWGLRIIATVAGVLALDLGGWPLALVAVVYLVLSFRKPKGRTVILRQPLISEPRRSWGRVVLGVSLLLLSGVAALEGGTYSPVVFLLGGLVVLLLPLLRRNPLASRVVPMKDSVLLRSMLFPMLWYALADVKLESQDQARGVASIDGRLIIFAGRSRTAARVVGVRALGHRRAEEMVVRKLRRETRMLSQRGAHLLPVDSQEAVRRLSLKLGRLAMGAEDMESVSSLPFDLLALDAREGLVLKHRAFRIEQPDGAASIPSADISGERAPLLAELVEEIGEKHGWPPPDEFSPFLASLDASRGEPLGDRLWTKGEAGGKVKVEAPGGAEVELTRAQLRMVARIYT